MPSGHRQAQDRLGLTLGSRTFPLEGQMVAPGLRALLPLTPSPEQAWSHTVLGPAAATGPRPASQDVVFLCSGLGNTRGQDCAHPAKPGPHPCRRYASSILGPVLLTTRWGGPRDLLSLARSPAPGLRSRRPKMT